MPASSNKKVCIPKKQSPVHNSLAIAAHLRLPHDLRDRPGDEVGRAACDGTIEHHDSSLEEHAGVGDLRKHRKRVKGGGSSCEGMRGCAAVAREQATPTLLGQNQGHGLALGKGSR